MEKLKGRTKKSPGEDRRGVENEKGIVRVFPEGVRKEEWLREIKFLFPRADSTKLLKTWEKFAKLHSNPTTRSWSSQELRHVKNFLLETGFRGVHIVELNQMLPDDSKMRDGSEVEEANVLMWSQMGQQLGIDMDGLYKELELLSLDRVKWSRRATKQPSESIAKEIREALGLSSEDNTYDLKGIQVKRARENCCFTDLKESVTNPDEGDVTEIFAKHKHPKNSAIKFTNYSFKASPQLKVFRERYGIVLGPFGYKFRGQFAELNKYYDKNRGIGRHGDVERGPKSLGCSGAVNCLKVGFRIPLLFSWYRDSRPVGKDKALSQLSLVSPFCFPSVKFGRKDWKTNTAAAVLTLGHGDGYMMSAKAIGQDWKSKDFALRHCAGARQYTNLPQSFYQVSTWFSNVGPYLQPRDRKRDKEKKNTENEE
ncbi:hypothetical protein AAMO2058_000635700 [Amorphochlora amoebiformis]